MGACQSYVILDCNDDEQDLERMYYAQLPLNQSEHRPSLPTDSAEPSTSQPDLERSTEEIMRKIRQQIKVPIASVARSKAVDFDAESIERYENQVAMLPETLREHKKLKMAGWGQRRVALDMKYEETADAVEEMQCIVDGLLQAWPLVWNRTHDLEGILEFIQREQLVARTNEEREKQHLERLVQRTEADLRRTQSLHNELRHEREAELDMYDDEIRQLQMKMGTTKQLNDCECNLLWQKARGFGWKTVDDSEDGPVLSFVKFSTAGLKDVSALKEIAPSIDMILAENKTMIEDRALCKDLSRDLKDLKGQHRICSLEYSLILSQYQEVFRHQDLDPLINELKQGWRRTRENEIECDNWKDSFDSLKTSLAKFRTVQSQEDESYERCRKEKTEYIKELRERIQED